MASHRQNELNWSEAASRKTKRLCCVGSFIGLLRSFAVAKPETTITSSEPSTPSDSDTRQNANAEHVIERDDEIDVEQVCDYYYDIKYNKGRPTCGEVWNLPIFFENSAYTPAGKDLLRKFLRADARKRGL